jgi:hypothetical protein
MSVTQTSFFVIILCNFAPIDADTSEKITKAAQGVFLCCCSCFRFAAVPSDTLHAGAVPIRPRSEKAQAIRVQYNVWDRRYCGARCGGHVNRSGDDVRGWKVHCYTQFLSLLNCSLHSVNTLILANFDNYLAILTVHYQNWT